MSAYIVSDATIDALVDYAIGGGPSRVSGDDPNKIGQMLVNENYRSVNYRYNETEDPHVYSYKPFVKPLTAVMVIKLCNHFDYQACETDDYEATEAARMINAIRGEAIRSLPGYDAAPWGLDDSDRSENVVLLSSLAR